MKHCIYKHTFPNGKVYIGQTLSGATERRWRNGTGYKGLKVYEGIKEFGWKNVKHEILEDDIDDEDVDERERFYINLYDSVRCGYNVSLGGKNIRDPHFLHKESPIAMHAFTLCGYKGLEDYWKSLGIKETPDDLNIKYVNAAFDLFERVYREVKGEAFLSRYDDVDVKQYAAEVLIYYSTRLPTACAAAREMGESIKETVEEGKRLVKAYLCSVDGWREECEIDARTKELLDAIVDERSRWITQGGRL